jgi:hypothetical protein
MDPNIRDLVARLSHDLDFQKRVSLRGERERARRRVPPRHVARKNRHLHPDRERARKAVAWAVKRGELIKPRRCTLKPRLGGCFGRIEPHHWHGYDEAHWLDVVWICRHHRELIESGDLALPYFALSGEFTKEL